MRRTYYWLVTTHHTSESGTKRKVLIYGGETEDEAYRRGMDTLGIHFDVIALPTRNQARATSMLKGRTLQDTADLDRALERVGHQVDDRDHSGGIRERIKEKKKEIHRRLYGD